MVLTVKHVFQSAKGDGVDATLVQPSNWNASHDLEMDTGNILGRKTAGAGPVEQLSPTDAAAVIGAATTAYVTANAQPLDADLTALAAIATPGLLAHTGPGAAAARTLTGVGAATVTNGDGAAGNPTISVLMTAVPCGRLTLATATPVMSADVASSGTVFYTPYRGLHVPIYDGANTGMASIGAELSLPLDSNAAHTGYHQSGKNFDLFIVNDAGTMRLVSGPAWAGDTARAIALEYKNGFLCNAASTTTKFDATASNLTVAQDRGFYVGTVRTSADGATKWVANPAAAAGGGDCQLLLFNAYNRVAISAISKDSTDSWAYGTAGWRPANASNSNRITAVFGLSEDRVAARYRSVVLNSNGGNGFVGIGLDSITAISGLSGGIPRVTSGEASVDGLYSGFPGIGMHFFQAMEFSGTGTGPFYGDNGAPANEQMGLMFEAMM